MYKLYSMRRSGNCYKVRLALAQLDIPHELIEIDILQGETRTPEFLKMNPSGHVPLLEVTPGRYIAESNAILCYLAEGSDLLPADAWQRAQVLQWLFFEQYSHEPYVAVARFVARWLPAAHPRQADPTSRGNGKPHDVFVYFDNDVKVRAPFDALNLDRILRDLEPKAAPDDLLRTVTEEARTDWPAWRWATANRTRSNR